MSSASRLRWPERGGGWPVPKHLFSKRSEPTPGRFTASPPPAPTWALSRTSNPDPGGALIALAAPAPQLRNITGGFQGGGSAHSSILEVFWDQARPHLPPP